MRIKDLLNSSRRVFFENDLEEFEYSGRGTCFLVRYRGSDFVVTAKHVIKGFSADSIRVRFHQASRAFVPYNGLITIKAEDASSDDDDWRDLAIFPLERTLYSDEQFGDELPYAAQLQNLWLPELPGRFILRGFPHERSKVDYDHKVLHEQAVILEADYDGRSSMLYCHRLKFRDLSHCTNLDGLSGAPMFWISDAEPRVHAFAGVAVRATYSSGQGHFVHASVVLAALEKALQPSK